MKHKRVLLYCVLAGMLLFAGCGKEKDKVVLPGDDTTEKIVNYQELSMNELEVLGYDGDVKAQYYLGLIFDYGIRDQQQDFETAKSWYERAAKLGDTRSAAALGYFYLNGCGVEKSLEQAAAYFQQAIDGGLTEANAGLARVYLTGYGDQEQMPSLVFSHATAAEKAGDLDGICLMGYLYEKGIGCEANTAQAISRYQKVLEAEDLAITDRFAWNEAATRLGVLYMEAEGDEKDEKGALSHFQMAADQGYAKAQYYVGIVYENGYGVGVDYAAAMRWYQMAAEQGYAPALNQIGYLYFNGYGVDVNYEEAAYYQKMSAVYGYGPAQLNLGFLYENGYGVEQNMQMALTYYQMAADQGVEGAAEAVGRVSHQL